MGDDRFKRVFNNLCHMLALSHEGKIEAAIDNLVITVIAIDPSLRMRTVKEIGDAIQTYFSLTFTDAILEPSINNQIKSGHLLVDKSSGIYVVSPQVQSDIQNRIKDAHALESDVRNEWLASVTDSFKGCKLDWEDQAWSCLKAYMTMAFQRHGAQTIMLLNPSLPLSEETHGLLSGYLEDALKNHCDGQIRPTMSESVKRFFRISSSKRSKYIAQLLDGTFTFYALTVDRETSEYLKGDIKNLKLFLDTNFIFAILGLHSNHLNDVSRELVDVVRKNNFPFSFHYHSETAQEFKRTVGAMGDFLKSVVWTPSSSRAAIKSGQFSGLELKYHEVNAVSATDPQIFLSKYEHVQELLAEQDFILYRAPDPSPEEDLIRHKLVIEYDAYLKKRRPDRPKQYEALNHDIAVWQTVKSLRKPGKSELDVGAAILTTDYYFYYYDMDLLREKGQVSSLVLPNQLLQLLRPFVPATEHFDRSFAEAFSIPEFRTIGTNYTQTCSRVLSYVNTYADVKEETAVKILTNEMVLKKLQSIPIDSPHFGKTIDSEIIRFNAELIENVKKLSSQVEEVKKKVDSYAESERESEMYKKTLAQELADKASKLSIVETVVGSKENKIQELQDEKTVLKTSLEFEKINNQKITEDFQKLRAQMKMAVVIFIGIVCMCLIWFLPDLIHWNWILTHHKKYGIGICSSVIVLSFVWLLIDKNKTRRTIAVSTGILSAILNLAQLIDP